jgi:hypothetical protein
VTSALPRSGQRRDPVGQRAAGEQIVGEAGQVGEHRSLRRSRAFSSKEAVTKRTLPANRDSVEPGQCREARMTPTVLYIVLLVVALALTFLVGRLLVTAGEPFLNEVFNDRKVTRSVNLLLSVLFHLITLGVLAIVSVIDFTSDNPLQTFVVRLGVVLLILGVAYGISMLVLIRIRERRKADEISEHVQERLAERAAPPPPTYPETTTRPVTPP